MSYILLPTTNVANFVVTGKDLITEIGTWWQDQNHAFFIDSLLFFNHNFDLTTLPFPVESADHAQLSSIISLSWHKLA